MSTYGAVAPTIRTTTDVLRPTARQARRRNPFMKVRIALAGSIARSRQADQLAGFGASAELGRQTGISC